MKKFLSLVLALVMTMSLVTVSAGAKDFTDDEAITYEEAVDVLSTIGVVDGYTDGSFNPGTLLNRGQAAKIICNLILGPTTASALSADSAPFSDVPVNHTFAGYIAYCSQNGIISGYADGTFRPTGTLTGYAFMKMLLGALGYDSAVEGYVGSNWSVQVAKQALGIGLNKGNDEFVGQKAVSREEACLYALNTLKADLVRYDNTLVVNNGALSTVSKAEKIPQFGSGYVDTTGDAANVVQFMEKYFPKLSVVGGPNALGRQANKWTFKNAEIGTYTTEDALLVYTADKSTTAGKSEITKALKGYDLTTAKVYRNGVEAATGTTVAQIAELTGNGILVEVYNDGTVITSVAVVESYVGKVTKVNNTDEKITIAIDGNGVLTTTSGYGTFVKDDRVMVTPVYSAVTPTVTFNRTTAADDAVVIAAEKVTGKVTATTPSKVTLDGTAYTAAEITQYSQPALKAEVEIYLDQYGYVVLNDNVAAKDFIYAVAVYQKKDDYGVDKDWIQGVLNDGTVVNYQIASTGVQKAAILSDITAGTNLYSYTFSSGKVVLTAADVADGSNAHYVVYKQDTDITSSDKVVPGTSRYFTDDTVFVSITGTLGGIKVTTSTGKQLVNSTDTADYAIVSTKAKKDNESADIAVVFVNNAYVSQNATDVLMIADASTTQGYEELNGKDYNVYACYINGEKQTVPIDSANDTMAKGNLYDYTKNSDGAYVLTARSSNVEAKKQATALYNNWVTINGTVYDLANATIVDTTDNGITDASALQELIEIDPAVVVTVSAVFNADKEISYLYILSATIPVTNSDTTWTVGGAITAADIQSVSYKTGATTNVDTVNASKQFTAPTTITNIKVVTIGGYTLTAA